MNRGTRWLVIDTETDGLCEPIHVVELCGQLMQGWEPIGEPFRMLLNHDVPIPPEATAIHGYTRQYLGEHGQDPNCVYTAFRDYAQDYRLVAHNLSFDWNRCLVPEWVRLQLPPIGQRGFCCMMLARRLVQESTSYRLEALKECFHLTQVRSHRAENDVFTVLELFQKVYRPRLESAGFETFDSIANFAKRTPVAKCLDMIRSGSKSVGLVKHLTDQWYFIDASRNVHGPLPAQEVATNSELDDYYVWREGMPDWVAKRDCPDFIALAESAPPTRPTIRRVDPTKTMGELIGVCRGIIADNKITTKEVMFLNSWLQDFPSTSEWPASEIAQTVEGILEDGVVTKGEKEQLKRLIQGIIAGSDTAITKLAQQTPHTSAPPTTSQKADHYVIVELEQGTLEWLKWRHQGIGASDAPAIMKENPWKSRADVFSEKCSPPRGSSQNEAMSRGSQLEPEARERYMAKSGKIVKPACLQSCRFEWLRASVDGLSISGDSVVEIKCGDSVYRKASSFRCVPDYYYGQLQHILAVTNLPVIDFWCYLPGRPEVLIPVARDEVYIERLLETELDFWSRVEASAR